MHESFYEYGFLDADTITTASGAGGNTDVVMRPAVGERWLVLWAGAYQDDAARQVVWTLTGAAGGNTEINRVVALAANALSELYRGNDAGDYSAWKGPLVLTREVYITLTVEAMAAAKNAAIRYVALKLRGVGTWGNT